MQWRATLAPIALCLLLSGCEHILFFDKVYDPCSPLILESPPDATEEERASIAEGVELWREVFAIATTLDEGPEDARRLPIEMVEESFYMGFFDDKNGVIRLGRRVTDPDVRAVVMAHELGHAFNLFHVASSERASVMNRGNKEVVPTAADAESLERKWGVCGP
jgi:hypothetical protein